MDKPLDLNDDIKTLIAERMEKGRKAYGHGLLPNAGYDWVQEALEEALDLAIYVSAKLLEIKKLTDTNAKQSTKRQPKNRCFKRK